LFPEVCEEWLIDIGRQKVVRGPGYDLDVNDP